MKIKFLMTATSLFVVACVVLFPTIALSGDITPPGLVNLFFNPKIIDRSKSTGAATVNFAYKDDLSGMITSGRSSYATFRSQSGKQFQNAGVLASNLVSGIVTNGVFQCKLTFPQFSEAGVWHIERVSLFDNVGNETALLTDALMARNIPVELTIKEMTNLPPVADVSQDQAVYDIVTLDGSGSTDPDGSITVWHWEITHKGGNPEFNRTAEGETVTLSNLAPGFYQATLTVTDNTGNTAQDWLTIAAAGPQTGMKGDINGNNQVDMADILYGLQLLSGHR